MIMVPLQKKTFESRPYLPGLQGRESAPNEIQLQKSSCDDVDLANKLAV